ncbi:hypothetical protein CWI37_0517p0030 [Hamiltosporidium tvaerminnensis]|uniref:Uncharacterized protein n=2 Tax=Hamiltosporidium TaxID=1176354 RepID=A0A4Q9LE00_9MICR|nr:hypothetical protein CWI37_0517p0030 [Hamiltosporidium tvaerminnensis]TBU06177.1 hypothetical protein CWI36_0499p0020 [Hamiltosporidium magnivora]
MDYDIPYLCPILVPKLCFTTFLCPCLVSSIVYARIFKNTNFSLFALICIPFSAYGIRRFVQNKLKYQEDHEVSILKSCFCCSSLVQDIHEMEIRRIGIYKYYDEPLVDESTEECENIAV